jgi:DNA-binding NarL/FixJ family response regulator
MQPANHPPPVACWSAYLWVGENEQDSTYLSALLRQTGDADLGLDHARTPEEAVARLSLTSYDLLLCEYKSGDGCALRLLHELHEVRKDGSGPPVIFLSDHMNDPPWTGGYWSLGSACGN